VLRSPSLAAILSGHGDESLPEEGCGENKRKFCPSSSTGAGLGLSKRSAKRARKANETVTKLPDEVRTSQFAEFMLGERFKFVPESDLKAAELKLYSFPRFSRCDALSYFPSTFASFINSGDMASISNLFDSFFHRSCNVTVTQSANTIPYTQYLSLVRMFNDLHPDVIMCMHSTKEVDNEIRSKLYFKFTENKIIYESVARTNKDPTVAPYLVPSRAEHLKRKFGLPPSTAEEEQQYRALLDSEDDVEVYACIDFRLCFNKHSKKVMQLKLLVDVTSLHRVDSCY